MRALSELKDRHDSCKESESTGSLTAFVSACPTRIAIDFGPVMKAGVALVVRPAFLLPDSLESAQPLINSRLASGVRVDLSHPCG